MVRIVTFLAVSFLVGSLLAHDNHDTPVQKHPGQKHPAQNHPAQKHIMPPPKDSPVQKGHYEPVKPMTPVSYYPPQHHYHEHVHHYPSRCRGHRCHRLPWFARHGHRYCFGGCYR